MKINGVHKFSSYVKKGKKNYFISTCIPHAIYYTQDFSIVIFYSLKLCFVIYLWVYALNGNVFHSLL